MNILAIKTFLRYTSVAGLAYAIDMGGYALLLHLGSAPLSANVSAKVVAAVSAFFMHRLVTYRVSGQGDVWAQARRYFFLCLINTPLSTVLLYLLMLLVNHPVSSKAVADILLFIGNYWVTTKFAFVVAEKKRAAEHAAAVGEGMDK